MTADRIVIRGLRVPARVGVTEAERSQRQNVLIDLELAVDLRRAGASDELTDTVDYDVLTSEIADLVRAAEMNLLEHLAEAVAQHVCANTRAERVSVEVTKESAPVSEQVGAISVRITRP